MVLRWGTFVAMLQKTLEASRMLHPKYSDRTMDNTPNWIDTMETTQTR